ncbi:hypothetical protein JCM17380_42300 [Desulfosporosinus burensis]
MKFLHIADLHIGKRVNEFSMLEDQKYILQDILRLVDEVKPTGILIAGDVYDKSVPAGEAVEVLDDFLTELVARQVQIFIVSGNHDSPERNSGQTPEQRYDCPEYYKSRHGNAPLGKRVSGDYEFIQNGQWRTCRPTKIGL